MKKIIGFALVLLASTLLFAYNGQDTISKRHAQPHSWNTLPQMIESINLNRGFNFAGEPVPIENPDARERLDRELLHNAYWHSNTLMCLKNGKKYFPIIEPILAQNGIPDDFKYLAVAESSLRNSVSPAGAKGFWQFLKSVGESYGLEINDEVDERYQIGRAHV